MNYSMVSILLTVAVLSSVANAFYLYLPRSYEPVDDSSSVILAYEVPAELPAFEQPKQELLQKRTSKGPIRRRSANGNCVCYFKVCPNHC